ncbi:hypothetical protein POX_d05163 [Penicillium oxalicum]|uniref:hypothetical protein n=1 Tax=Penicillium oxalicum TaxID=69781 RepID=UPI0020B7EAAD|nr:hypothetical protein POX_d05163 [Penicillium oxalicum]KAI2789668.1 hypothetical protein POX_d05163 [Penicillium oxalicum]
MSLPLVLLAVATKAVIVALEMITAEPIVSPTVITNQSALSRNHAPKDAVTICGDDCVASCERKSECDPGGYGDHAEAKNCPLNVCCSKFGFCGVTKEFCGNKKVKRPSCSKTQDLTRVVGYYEGWSVQRPCHIFYPDQIPLGVYTHLNYAFASVDPETFQVLAPSEYEKTLMKRLTSLKKSDPDLKVFIAIGGWTFNDPGATRTVLSDIARSEANQRGFFNSLKTFLTEYNFDGIDLDWEYPVADDRGGRQEDFKNFPKFLANLKSALSDTGRSGISMTLPASYWYLQHFDLENLVKHVDFFNIMSYDLHGKWDLGNEWLDPVLNSHTNLTEITNALDLIWRNNVPSDKVVLGLAFYGRVFSAADPACMDPGCPFVSGGNPGVCSDEVGIMLNSEIMDIMDEQQLSSTFDKEAAVKILKFNTNQWLTYDNGDTFKLKTDFARSECLGGVMVWAVSHDLPYGNFSRVLGETIGRKVTSLQFDKESDSLEVTKTHQQCKWTNCFEDCPKGWSRIDRTDPGARTDEKMWDATGCGGSGSHTFCCPPDSELPKCGWYTHNNGNCDSQCPSGYVEVGSNFQHCSNNKNDYQAACCTTDTDSMKLYSQCNWAGHAPDCDKSVCKSSETNLFNSTTGSGGNYCYATKVKYTWNGNEGVEWQSRKYCCDDDTDKKWDDCEWRTDIGLAAADGVVEGYCRSGCPNDKVRVGLDQHGGGCRGDGGRAQCCLPKYITKSKRSYTDAESALEKNVKAFLADPDCGPDAYQFKRDLEGIEFVGLFSKSLNHSSSLQPRFNTKPYESMHQLIQDIAFTSVAGAAARQIWNDYVVPAFPNFKIETLRAWLNRDLEWRRQGSDIYADMLICNMGIYNAKLGGQKSISCACTQTSCCTSDDPDLCAGEDLDGTEVADLTTRSLVKRAGPRPFSVGLSNGATVRWRSLSYRSRGDWPIGHPIWSEAFGYENDVDCLDVDVGTVIVTLSGDREPYDVEHSVELNTIQMFLRDASRGTLPTTAHPRNLPLPDDYTQALNTPMLLNAPPMAGGQASSTPLVRMMNALGSRRNGQDFLVLIQALNGLKSRMWRNVEFYDNMENLIADNDYLPALRNIRSVITVIHYLNHPKVHPHLINTANEVRTELGLADQEWISQGNHNPRGQDWWDQWIRELFRRIGAESRNWVSNWVTRMRNIWAVRTGDDAVFVLEALARYKSLASDMDIDLEGLN